MVENIPAGIWIPAAVLLWGWLILDAGVRLARRIADGRRVLDIAVPVDGEVVVLHVVARAWEAMTEHDRREFVATWIGWRRR